MRQITALVPTPKTLLGLIWFRRRRPKPLAFDQIAHAGIMRRSGSTQFGWLIHANIEPETVKRRKSWKAPGRGCVAETSRSSFATQGAWGKIQHR